jgi:hypothetical protein
LAHRVIEYVEDGLAQPSEPSIPASIGRVTSRPRTCRAHQQVGDEVDFPSSFGHRQWMLHPVDADFEATTLQDSAKRTRLIISATRYSPDYPAKSLAGAVSVVGVGAGIAASVGSGASAVDHDALITDPGSHGSHRRERGGQDGRRCALRVCW